MGNLKIGALARQTGTNAPTIRYYEGVGLLPKPPRSDGNRRLYAAAAVDKNQMVAGARNHLDLQLQSLLRAPCKI